VSCTVGTTVQPGLTFGYDIPLVVFQAQQGGAVTILPAVGYCFHQCQSLETCASFAGTLCGSADESVFGADWNNLAMCLPPVLLNEER
jgi:hypothetical protein